MMEMETLIKIMDNVMVVVFLVGIMLGGYAVYTKNNPSGNGE